MSRHTYSYENRMFTDNMKCSTILGWKGKALEAGKDKSVGAN